MTFTSAPFVDRVVEGSKHAWKIAVAGLVGYGWGHVYAKLSDLPTKEVAKAWAVYLTVMNTLSLLISIVFESVRSISITRLGIISTGYAYFITEMRKRELMGDKMTYLMVAFWVYTVFYDLMSAITGKEFRFSKEEKAPQ